MIVQLPGYSIRVSNSSVLPPPENSCFTDTDNVTLPNIIENDCERTARYVWFYRDNDESYSFLTDYFNRPNPIIEICEVQVFGMYIVRTVFIHEIQFIFSTAVFFNHLKHSYVIVFRPRIITCRPTHFKSAIESWGVSPSKGWLCLHQSEKFEITTEQLVKHLPL